MIGGRRRKEEQDRLQLGVKQRQNNNIRRIKILQDISQAVLVDSQILNRTNQYSTKAIYNKLSFNSNTKHSLLNTDILKTKPNFSRAYFNQLHNNNKLTPTLAQTKENKYIQPVSHKVFQDNNNKKKKKINVGLEEVNKIDEEEKSIWNTIINQSMIDQTKNMIDKRSLVLDFIEVNQSFAHGGLILYEKLSEIGKGINYIQLSLPKRSMSEVTMQLITSSLSLMKLYHLRLDLLYSYINIKSLRCLQTLFKTQNDLIQLQLNFKWCKINIKKIDIIATSLLYHQRLRIFKVDFSFNEIGAKGFSLLFERLSEYPSLLRFQGDFTMNDIKGDGLTRAAKYIKRMKKMEYLALNLKMNEIDDKGFFDFCSGLKGMQQLKYLDLQLQSNSISHLGFTTLTEYVCSLNDIIYLFLNVYENNIPKERFENFAKQIINLQYLMHFEFVFERCIIQQNTLICHVDKEINTVANAAHSIINTRKTPFKPLFKACQYINQSLLKKAFRIEILQQIINCLL